MPAFSIRSLWLLYKNIVLRDALGIRRRNEVQILTQNAFYLGAQCVLQCLAFMIEKGHYDEAHDLIRRQGRLLKAIRTKETRARARQH